LPFTFISWICSRPFYDFSESSCEIVPCCLVVPPLYLLFRSVYDRATSILTALRNSFLVCFFCKGTTI
jgi:hypothetical protein